MALGAVLPSWKVRGRGRRAEGRAGGLRGRLGAEAGPPVPSLLASLTLTAPRCSKQEWNKEAEWGGERVGRRRTPGLLSEDPGRRKPKCHLNSTPEASAWDPSALFSNNGRSASYKLPESQPGRRTITCAPALATTLPDPSIASRWKGNSRMKSKKGKSPRVVAGWALVLGKYARQAVLSLGRVTWWTSQARARPIETAAVLFVEVATEMAVAVFLLDTT